MHRAAITEIRLLNWLKAGRGQGFGESYLPLIQITRQDHASIGMSPLMQTPRFERQHHMVSNLERSVLTHNFAHPFVEDVREQFPAWPFAHPSPLYALCEYHRQNNGNSYVESEGTVAIAQRLCIRHANFFGLKIKYIYTTDQLLTVALPNGERRLIAISIKYRSGLRDKKERKRTFQKFRIEREYWRSLGVPWLLITENQLHETVGANLEWALAGAIQRMTAEDYCLLEVFVVAIRAVEWTDRLKDVLTVIANALRINQETATRLFMVAVWRSLLPIDLTRPIDLLRPIPRMSGPARGWPAWCLFKSVEGKL